MLAIPKLFTKYVPQNLSEISTAVYIIQNMMEYKVIPSVYLIYGDTKESPRVYIVQ